MFQKPSVFYKVFVVNQEEKFKRLLNIFLSFFFEIVNRFIKLSNEYYAFPMLFCVLINIFLVTFSLYAVGRHMQFENIFQKESRKVTRSFFFQIKYLINAPQKLIFLIPIPVVSFSFFFVVCTAGNAVTEANGVFMMAM